MRTATLLPAFLAIAAAMILSSAVASAGTPADCEQRGAGTTCERPGNSAIGVTPGGAFQPDVGMLTGPFGAGPMAPGWAPN